MGRLMLSQDTMEVMVMEVMALIMVMADMDTEDTEVMEDMDIEVTMARDLLMLSQDIMVMEDMDMVDIEVMEVMDMVADTMDKKLVHTIQFKAINHKFYFKT